MTVARRTSWASKVVVYAATLVFSLAALPLFAQSGVTLDPTLPDCVPSDDNVLVSLTVVPEIGWSSVRAYFRDHDEDLWYFVEMRAMGGGKYWAVFPKPEADTQNVDVRFRVRNDQGALTESEIQTLPVTSRCNVRLTEEQQGYARNLVIGETSPDQKDREVFGFQCDGIISRLEEYTGDLRPDEYCRAVLLAAVVPKSRLFLLLPLAFTFEGGGGGGVVGGGEPGTVSNPNP